MIIDSNSQRILVMNHCGDVVYDVNIPQLGSAVGTEDLPVIGDWEDYTGSANVPSRQQQMWAGATNQLQGTDASLIDPSASIGNLNVHGNNSDIYRSRQRRIYAEVETIQ